MGSNSTRNFENILKNFLDVSIKIKSDPHDALRVDGPEIVVALRLPRVLEDRYEGLGRSLHRIDHYSSACHEMPP
jgi:hypothetical protein